jgi:hypothetical protein
LFGDENAPPQFIHKVCPKLNCQSKKQGLVVKHNKNLVLIWLQKLDMLSINQQHGSSLDFSFSKRWFQNAYPHPILTKF